MIGYYDTASDLAADVAAPTPGDAYGVGTAAPYDIYIYDGTNSIWVNNGPLQGAKGDTGYSPVRGTDYWTDDDIAEIKGYVDDAILGGAW